MSAVSDWQVEDLLMFLAFDLEPDALAFKFNCWWLYIEGAGYSDISELVAEALDRKLLWCALERLHFTQDGISAAREAEHGSVIVV